MSIRKSALGLFFLSTPFFAVASDIVINVTDTGKACRINLINGIVIDPANGDIVGSSTKAGFGANCLVQQPTGSPPIDTLSVSAASVSLPNSNFSLTWTTDSSATSCSTTGSAFPSNVDYFPAQWPINGSLCSGQACAGTHSVSLTPSVAGSYTFSAICSNNFGTAVPVTKIVTVSSPSGPSGSCAPGSLTQQLSTDARLPSGVDRGFVDATTYESIFGYNSGGAQLSFPDSNNLLWLLSVQSGQYLSMRFRVSANLPDTTTGTFQAADTLATWSSVSISKCSGNFSTNTDQLPAACRWDNSKSARISWSVDPSRSGYCTLEKGQDYYLNVVMAPLSNPDQSNCAVCSAGIKHSSTY